MVSPSTMTRQPKPLEMRRWCKEHIMNKPYLTSADLRMLLQAMTSDSDAVYVDPPSAGAPSAEEEYVRLQEHAHT